ncbi:MAG: ATPase [Actinomycetota bacterium]
MGTPGTETCAHDGAPPEFASLRASLENIGPRIVACSGGIDSLILATVAHAAAPEATLVAHTVTPAVPSAGTARVVGAARRNGWSLEIVQSNEFEDERYLANPTNRCYFCKTNLYDAIGALAGLDSTMPGATVVSGANVDDLGDYRPGLLAADEHGVRHPYVEAGVDKSAIRAMARYLGFDEPDLPASPCLASRLYTGTRVTADRLRAIELGEAVLADAGFPVNRCRLREDDVHVEVPGEHRERVTTELLADVERAMRSVVPELGAVNLDDRPYRAGQAVLGVR